MAQYRKKPVVIEAVQFVNPLPLADSPEWLCAAISDGTIVSHPQQRECLEIKTLEGWYIASPGDWIIRGVKSELYPCKPDIFAATYEQVT